MNVKYRHAVENDIDEICSLVKNAVITMEENGIHQWDEVYPATLKADGFEVVSGLRTTGDGYYESCIVAIEGNQIEITV